MLQHWIRKFQLAGRGVWIGIAGQSSFAVHLPVAGLVIVLAYWLQCSLWQWCALLICIGLVLTAELANSAIEELAKGLCTDHNPQVGRALDMAAGAVLIASIIAATVGLTIFAYQLFSD